MTDTAGGIGDRFRGKTVTWIGFFCLLAWTRVDSPWILAATSLCIALSAARAARGWRHASATLLLGAGVVVGFHTDATTRRLSSDWAEYWEERRSAVAERVGLEFDALVVEGERTVARVSELARVGSPPAVLQDSLRNILEESGMTAVAVLDEDGRFVAWEGSHHGRLPEGVAAGTSRYAYSGTPLFSYLYFAAEQPAGGGTAVAASLMGSDLPAPFASGLGDFASRFAEESGERIRIESSERTAGPGVLDLGWPDETLLSIAIVEPDPSERRSEVRASRAGLVVILAALAWLLHAFYGARGGVRYAVGGLVAAAVMVPLESILKTPEFLALATRSLDGPLPLSLGRVLLLGAAAAPIVILAGPRRRLGSAAWVLPVTVAISFPLILSWLGDAASLEVLGSSDLQWVVFQLAATLVLTLVAGTALLFRGRADSRSGSGLAVVGMAVAVGLGVAVAAGVRTGPHVAPGLAMLWVLPAILVGRGVEAGSRVSYPRWFCAFWLSATAVLPFAWSMRTEARMAIAEQQLGQLGIAPDPEVHTLLDRFANQVDSLHRAGAGAVEMMYQSWVSSGLSAQGSPIFLTLWSGEGNPEQELRLGVKGDLPPVVGELLPEIRTAGTREHHLLAEVDVRHLIAVSLSDGRVVTGTIPPRRTIAEPSELGPLFSAVEEGGDQEFLTLVRSPGGTPGPGPGRVAWSRNAEGWMGEISAAFPDGNYSVAYTISIPNLSVMFARATLVLVLNLVVISLLWLLSVWILGFRFSVPIDWRELFTSFRARVTWTLFGFFILSNVVFGTLAYRTLSGASERTATALAERVVSQIAEVYREEGGSMELLARRVGADLLEYRRGELVGGSADELIELGLYESWVDPEIYAALETGQQREASKVASLGDWRYVLAHRRLPDGDIVASPVPLRAGAAALRRRDVADLLGVAIVLGPILSLGLALIVGRALARPIQTLQVASERVGRGNLAVHLPEDRLDEFGAVFAAFNRMVLRLGEARRELLRTTRRTQAIVEEVATGVIALDTRGRVTVANPVAESLLGAPLETGATIPRSGERGGELADWLDTYRKSGASESDGDFRWTDRRIRARARRVVQEGRVGGVVVSLEDVTDELRSERILAWGEMAKQVAHEVKNPLTPIKLSVQHLRRAWSHRRSDFGGILDRNVTTILGEIDRLAAIARSFSRLASPAAENTGPLEAVDVELVVGEVLDLYEGGAQASVQLVGELADHLPQVACRADELKQVLLNLVENSRAAMPGGGVVRILAAEAEDRAGEVAVTVVDEGRGIPEQLLPRIFEPRFSTRSKGAGLGLAIVKRLVDSWSGTVEVESRIGRGTTVRIRLGKWLGSSGAPAVE
ncbi:MAG: ATP-binding protein [Gemmatimonadota bacterium]|nr:ATP-binding protein [Gemmatimonadota bacterium]